MLRLAVKRIIRKQQEMATKFDYNVSVCVVCMDSYCAVVLQGSSPLYRTTTIGLDFTCSIRCTYLVVQVFEQLGLGHCNRLYFVALVFQ